MSRVAAAQPIAPHRRPLRPGVTGALFATPALALIMLVIIYPLTYAVWASFTNLRLTTPRSKFVGFDTYASALGNEIFHDALGVTLVFLAVAIFIEFVLGFLLAMSFWRMKRTWPLLRSLLLLPIMVTPVTAGLVWKLMLNHDFGLLAQLGEMLGAGRVLWLSDPTLAMVSIILMDVWQWTPFMFLVLLAGLESLPAEPFESAAVDGASPMLTLRRVTLPLMRRVIAIALVFRLMFALATFDTVFVLTRGGPARATDLVTLYIYREGFINLNISYASAVSFLLLIVVLVIVLGFFRRSLSHVG